MDSARGEHGAYDSAHKRDSKALHPSHHAMFLPRSVTWITCAIGSICVVTAMSVMGGEGHKPVENTLPFVSDGGLKDPERMIFSAGLMASAFGVFLTVQFLHRVIQGQLHAWAIEQYKSTETSSTAVAVDVPHSVTNSLSHERIACLPLARANDAAQGVGLAASLFLFLVGMFPYSVVPSAHLGAAFLFFFFTIGWMLFSTWVMARVHAFEVTSHSCLQEVGNGFDSHANDAGHHAAAARGQGHGVHDQHIPQDTVTVHVSPRDHQDHDAAPRQVLLQAVHDMPDRRLPMTQTRAQAETTQKQRVGSCFAYLLSIRGIAVRLTVKWILGVMAAVALAGIFVIGGATGVSRQPGPVLLPLCEYVLVVCAFAFELMLYFDLYHHELLFSVLHHV